MRYWIMFAALAAVAATGCGRKDTRPAGPITTRVTEANGRFVSAEPSAVSEDVNPVVGAATVRPPAGAPSPKPSNGHGYSARLDEVPLPVPGRVPVLGPGTVENPRLVDAILAKVNDEVITREQILGPLRPEIAKWRTELPPEEFDRRVRQVVDLRLREEISARLVIQEANRRLSEQDKAQVDAMVGEIRKNRVSQAGSEALLEEKLKSEGRTVEEEMQRERERLLIQRFLRDQISPKVHVTHSDLVAYYDQVRQERYVMPTRVHMRLIVIKKSEFPDPAQALAQAQMVGGRAKAGEDFARLAKKYSQGVMAGSGGDWGYVTQGAFKVKGVDDILFSLQSGEVGPLLETEDGFYIIKAEQREAGRVVPFTEVQEDLDREVRDKQYNQIVSKYIQDLFEHSYVQVMTENL